MNLDSVLLMAVTPLAIIALSVWVYLGTKEEGE